MFTYNKLYIFLIPMLLPKQQLAVINTSNYNLDLAYYI